MSDFSIKDGTGTGYRAAVSNEGRLLTVSQTLPQVAVETLKGNEYVLPIGVRIITTVDTEHPILYVNPNTTGKAFFPQRFALSVLNSPPVVYRLYRGSSVPTANNITFPPGNANTLSTNTAALTAMQWNGVGTGMTVASKGTEAFSGFFPAGFTDVPIEGSQLWGLNSHILVTVECSATNRVASVVTGWEGSV